MGENLKLIQYDENAMILHVLSLALLLLIGLLIPADMIVGGSAAYDHKKKVCSLLFPFVFRSSNSSACCLLPRSLTLS